MAVNSGAKQKSCEKHCEVVCFLCCLGKSCLSGFIELFFRRGLSTIYTQFNHNYKFPIQLQLRATPRSVLKLFPVFFMPYYYSKIIGLPTLLRRCNLTGLCPPPMEATVCAVNSLSDVRRSNFLMINNACLVIFFRRLISHDSSHRSAVFQNAGDDLARLLLRCVS